ncbi:DnaJ domain-containing protein [Hirsutella rhossiliensis]|uniref:DnaJ domain-containing protein n=1 Tax=Hirsutella rhossiliensis TaxID=111463 RepID=A0A9P8SLD7_9HYPO|nr:dnaJ domain-containing protein [Hirsutella rhossiliensis]KAH0965705.1 dnaJ domain-containing protein [Hirsutella rhossiliensis]
MAAERDWYADLELPETADIQEIKKQFRKLALALKYHPDRNPGREVEVNSKFQIIQSAHEVLTDPQLKAKYDNVGQQFPPPPRRNTAARNATSGAQRWQSRFSNGVPPTAKQQAPSDAEAKKNAARAFENMRKSQAQPPPPPPRTESARQRAQAAFGSRKAGFQPHSSMPGDEPPVSGQNYYPRTGTEQPRAPSPPPRKPHPTAMPDPLNQFRARAGFADSRQSTPYSSHGDEGVFQEQDYRSSGARKFATPRKPVPGRGASGQDGGGPPPNAEKQPDSEERSGSAPSMYDAPHDEHPFPRSAFATNSRFVTKSLDSVYGPCADFYSKLAPSGNQDALQSHPSFEVQQHLMLDRLISNMGTGLQPERKRACNAERPLKDRTATDFADEFRDVSFNFAVGDDAFEPTSPVPDPRRSAKSSVDDINTRFVNDDGSSTWQFSAVGRANRRSPLKRQTARETGHTDHQPQPEPSSGASSSPTRPSRANSKKVRVRPTVGNAAVVEESSSDGETYEWRGRNTQAKPAAADSPQAMDIDSPPFAPVASSTEPSSVRNIPVEPSRPEWRPGNVDSMAGETQPERPEKIPINANAVGSEDSEEFKASFAELKNVAPFAQPGSGLKSLADLKDNLPFESRASEDLPIKLPKVQPLVFPEPPEAPRLPPTVAIEGMKPNAASWVKYLAEFESYLEKWDKFNGQVVDHFATRRALISRTRSSKGYAFLGARGDGDVREYFNWVQQDNDVRQRWNACCDQHEKRLGEFMTFREKMK